MTVTSTNSADLPAPRFLDKPLTPLIIEPVMLEGQYVRLEPLTLAHHAALCSVALDEALWRWIPTPVTTADELRQYIDLALRLQSDGTALPFVTISKADNRVAGSSRYLNIDKSNRHLEIGSTFVGKAWQRTQINTEAKYLMLRHAFEQLGCIRVEFKTDSLNERSQKALARIGAVREGIFRNHMLCSNGRIRHSVYFSITDSEWPTVRRELEAKLARPFVPTAR